MFKRSYNRAVLRIRVETVTPLRIGAGDISLDPSGADLTCVRTRHGTQGRTVYIPGSSLKGVIRAAAEASVRGRSCPGGPAGACDDPHDHRERSCGASLQRPGLPAPEVHRRHCLACRLFGSLAIHGRASVRDLFPWREGAPAGDPMAPGGDNHVRANRLEVRYGVAIDRMLGAVKHGPFEQEVVPAGVAFCGEVALENYQVWQLGLLATAFARFDDGVAQLGASTSRGLGVVRIAIEQIVHEQAGRGRGPCGVGELAAPEERAAYGLLEERALPPAGEGAPRGLATRFEIHDGAAAWLEAGSAALGALL